MNKLVKWWYVLMAISFFGNLILVAMAVEGHLKIPAIMGWIYACVFLLVAWSMDR